MGGRARTSTRRTGSTAILAVLLCVFALVAPTTAGATNGPAHTGSHALAVVGAATTYQHALTLRLEQPRLLSAVGRVGPAGHSVTTTATSSTISSLATV